MEERDATKESGRAVAGRFGLHAIVYLVSTLLLRGIGIVLTPFYTRMMSPGDFAVIAIANAVTSVLSIVVGLGMYGAIPRLYYDYATPEDRRRFLGTLTIGTFGFSILVGVVLELVGQLGGLELFALVPFHPYLRLVIWASVLTGAVNLPTVLYVAIEQPRKVSLLNAASGLSQLGLTIVFVAVLRQGALGVLRAGLVSGALMAALSLVLMLRRSSLAFSWPILRSVLTYCLPLVPHLLANWALAVSDRLVIARYVPPEEVARYSLAYMLSTLVALVASAVATPISPAANRQLGDPVLAKSVPPLGTYALLMTIAAALLVAVNAGQIVRILAPPSYASAARIVPWVVAGAALQGFYVVWSTGTWYSKKTRAVPLVTAASVGVNVGLNFLFVPRYGVIVAGISTLAGYAVSAGLHGLLAQRNHPIPWEYRRWVVMVVSALVAYALFCRVVIENVILAIVVKSAAALAVFALGLVAFGFGRHEFARLFGRLLRRPG